MHALTEMPSARRHPLQVFARQIELILHVETNSDQADNSANSAMRGSRHFSVAIIFPAALYKYILQYLCALYLAYAK